MGWARPRARCGGRGAARPRGRGGAARRGPLREGPAPGLFVFCYLRLADLLYPYIGLDFDRVDAPDRNYNFAIWIDFALLNTFANCDFYVFF